MMHNFKKVFCVVISAMLVAGSLSACQQEETPEVEMEGQLLFDWDEELEKSLVSKADSINMLTATDDFGRTFDPIAGQEDKERYVGLFYFLWMGQHGGQQSYPYDISQMLEDGVDELWETKSNSVSPIGAYHYWGKPLYGYYNSMDEWVIRKHLELLTLAGIDFLVFDTTNGFEYAEVCNVILPIMQEYYDSGWNVPKIVFYTNSNSATVVQRLYSGYETKDANKSDIYNYGIYKEGRYRDLWFCPNGKPMIIGVTSENGGASQESAKETSVITDPEILEFFEIKESQWPNSGIESDNGFPWIQFSRPNKAFGEVINVSVAQHNKLPFSDAALTSAAADAMWGRGYTTQYGVDHSNTAIESGLNFEEQWSVAKQADVKYTFLTGWNEWIALKQVGAPGNSTLLGSNYERAFFVDTFNEEYSRDIEMMEDGYFDNFYLQMTRNIRDFKGISLTTPTYAPYTTIDISKGLKQWNAVSNVYYDFSGETIERDSDGISDAVHYTDTSNRNDIEEVRVASNEEYVYFLVKCKNEVVVDLTSGNWMNILIDVNGKAGGWKGYNYLINRSVTDKGVSSVESLDASGSRASAGNARVSVNGKYVQYRIPKLALGITGENYRIDFKICDNVQDMSDLASYYTTGDVCPAGRANYAYYAK